MLCEVVKSLVQEISKEDKLFQHCLVGLSQVRCLQGLRQFIDKLLVFLIVELFLEVGGLFDIVVDFEL